MIIVALVLLVGVSIIGGFVYKDIGLSFGLFIVMFSFFTFGWISRDEAHLRSQINYFNYRFLGENMYEVETQEEWLKFVIKPVLIGSIKK